MADVVGDTGQHLDQPARLQVAERDVRRSIEHPLARQHLGPCIRHPNAAHLAEEYEAHLHVLTAAEPKRLERDLHFDDVTVRGGLRGTEPHHVGVELLPGRRRIERVHLAAAGVGEKVIRRLTRAGGIKAEGKPVVVERAVAFGDVGADSVGLVVETVEREVDVAIVVGDANLRAIRIGHPVAASKDETQSPVGIGATCAHAASSSTPSMFGGVAAHQDTLRGAYAPPLGPRARSARAMMSLVKLHEAHASAGTSLHASHDNEQRGDKRRQRFAINPEACVGVQRAPIHGYSQRSATIGSTLVARRAGKYVATRATVSTPIDDTTASAGTPATGNVTGAFAWVAAIAVSMLAA